MTHIYYIYVVHVVWWHHSHTVATNTCYAIIYFWICLSLKTKNLLWTCIIYQVLPTPQRTTRGYEHKQIKMPIMMTLSRLNDLSLLLYYHLPTNRLKTCTCVVHYELELEWYPLTTFIRWKSEHRFAFSFC